MSEKTESPSGVSGMRDAPLREELALVAGPRGWGDTRESWLSRAARRTGISFRSAKAIFYGETRDPRSSVERAIRDAARIERERQARRADADRLLSVAAALESKDHEFHRTDIESYRAMAAQLRDMVRDGDVAGEGE